MSRKNFVLDILLEKGEVLWKSRGSSMSPRIHSGDEVLVKRIDTKLLRVNDIVYAKVAGNFYLHLLSAIDGTRYQISNNHGHVNGWVGADAVYGLCVKVKDKVFVSEETLERRS